MRVLGALAALLLVGGFVGLFTVSGDDDGDSVDTAASTTTSTSGSVTTAVPLPTTGAPTSVAGGSTTATATTSTSVASGLATGGSATVQGSEAMADTGGEDLLLPAGLVLLGLALGARRLRARTVD